MMNLLKHAVLLLVIFLAGALPAKVEGQGNKRITLDAIYRDQVYSVQTVPGLTSMKDGQHFTMLKEGRIEAYSYRTGKTVETLFDATAGGDSMGIHPESIDNYYLSENEEKILLETGKEKIYRHSFLASYFVFDRRTGALSPLSEGGKQQCATFSPDGSRVAFVRNNNLFIKELENDREIKVTLDGIRNEIINGIPDWVYEEEFAFSRGFEWSPDGKKIAFYRFDEGAVKEFQLTYYGDLYPQYYRYKYPKAGETNSEVTIHVYDLESGVTRKMDTGSETDQYIPRIKWTKDPAILSILRLNRLQNKLDILHAHAYSGQSGVVYSETNDAYISEPKDQTVNYLPDGESFILISERNGYFQLYRYRFTTGEIHAITDGEYDVCSFLGYDENTDRVYYTSYEASSTEKYLYSIRLDGTGKKKLSSEPGVNSAVFSQSYKFYILTHSSINEPPRVSIHTIKGKELSVLEENRNTRKAMTSSGFSRVEFLRVPTPSSGTELNAWMLKPGDFDPGKKYPLLVYVYGGPESQKVVDAWDRRMPWFQFLAQQGYLVACVDNRGTNGRGEAFRKSTYLTLGRLETIDQLESATWFGNLDYVDAGRMGIFGWSYGGFMSCLCLTKGDGLFKMGIAVAPVTNWRYYDTIYTERFMRTPADNPDGYDENSPLYFAEGLRGKLLVIHGSADDNVHFQNSMDFAEALVQANKQFEMQVYPNKNHSITGGNTSFHLYTRMTHFILENL